MCYNKGMKGAMYMYTKEEIALAKDLLDAIHGGKSIDYLEGRLEAMIQLDERDRTDKKPHGLAAGAADRATADAKTPRRKPFLL